MSDQVDVILGQPRAYLNLGNDGSGQWLGFRHERNRIPQLFPPNNNPAANPRFCSVAAGDYNNDGYQDLFFVDYDTPETSGTHTMDLNGDGDTNDPGETQQSPAESGNDYNNKLIYNYGASGGGGPGFFYDTLNTVCNATQLASAFGNAVVAGDFSGDGKTDIARVSTLGGSGLDMLTRKATGLNGLKSVYSGAPYNTEKGDMNGDGKLDLVVADDGQDRYIINIGNDALGQPNFTSYVIAQSAGEFGNTIRIADWDKDGKPDVVIVDIDADLPSFCPTTGRRTHMYRNNYSGSDSGILVESNASFSKPFTDAQQAAWFDVAPIDLDNDGWLDMIVGRCASVEVWMNRQVNVTFAYPSGRPAVVAPGESFSFPVTFTTSGGGTLVPASVKMHYSVNGGVFVETPLASNGGNNFTGTLPASLCGDKVTYYLEASMSNGGPYRDPTNAPYAGNAVTIGRTTVTALSANLESGADGFVVVNTGLVGASKGWEPVTPIATSLNGNAWAPGSAANGVKAMVTNNGTAGGGASASDLDGGPSVATSPSFSLLGVDHPTLSYSRWYANDDTLTPSEVDPLVIEISNDGGTTWTLVEQVASHGNNSWRSVNFQVENIVPLTATMQLRFRIQDNPDNSVTEAAFDNVVVAGAQCIQAPACPADLTGDGVVNGADLSVVLGGWGGRGIGDLTGDGTIDGADLAALLGT